MGRTCTICRSTKRAEIEEATFAGEPPRSIAARTGTAPSSIIRHREAHIGASLVVAQREKDVAAARTLAEGVAALRTNAERITQQAEADGDGRLALLGNRLLLDIEEALAKAAQAEQAVDLPEGLDRRVVSLLLRLTPEQQTRFAETGTLPLAARKEVAGWLDIQTK